jgi:hypothetical protein
MDRSKLFMLSNNDLCSLSLIVLMHVNLSGNNHTRLILGLWNNHSA